MHDVAWYCAMNYVRSRDAQKQLARTSLISNFSLVILNKRKDDPLSHHIIQEYGPNLFSSVPHPQSS